MSCNFTSSLAFKIMLKKFNDISFYLVFQQVSLHTILCLIAGVLSLHLVFIFLGRESDSREIYKAKCKSNFKGSCEFVNFSLSLWFNLIIFQLLITCKLIVTQARSHQFPFRFLGIDLHKAGSYEKSSTTHVINFQYAAATFLLEKLQKPWAQWPSKVTRFEGRVRGCSRPDLLTLPAGIYTPKRSVADGPKARKRPLLRHQMNS